VGELRPQWIELGAATVDVEVPPDVPRDIRARLNIDHPLLGRRRSRGRDAVRILALPPGRFNLKGRIRYGDKTWSGAVQIEAGERARLRLTRED
jgi:hypothetical protein